jgi:hypothetical protein
MQPLVFDKIEVLANAFNKSKGEIKRLIPQNGIHIVKYEGKTITEEFVFSLDHKFIQDEIVRIGPHYKKLHFMQGVKTWEDENFKHAKILNYV